MSRIEEYRRAGVDLPILMPIGNVNYAIEALAPVNLLGRSVSAGERVGLFFRFARVQFLPVILAPILVGTAAAWYVSHTR